MEDAEFESNQGDRSLIQAWIKDLLPLHQIIDYVLNVRC